VETLDLHNTRHNKVENKLLKFVNWQDPPFRIITGNSPRMREIVKEIINNYGYFCYNESAHNSGSLIVTESKW